MNYSKLKGLMREKNITQAELAAVVGICETSMNKRLSGKSDFNISEINAIAQYLGIFSEIQKYFFCE